MAKPAVLLYEPIHEDALAILKEKAEIRWAESPGSSRDRYEGLVYSRPPASKMR